MTGPTLHDEAAMARALELARIAAELGEVPVGAVVYRTADGEMLGEGHNLRHTKRDPVLHAEVVAVQAAARAIGDWRLNDCTLVVTLEPCVMCAGVVINARVGRLVYACPDPKAGFCGSLGRLTEDPRLNHRVTPITGLMHEPASELLKSFFRARRAPRETEQED